MYLSYEQCMRNNRLLDVVKWTKCLVLSRYEEDPPSPSAVLVTSGHPGYNRQLKPAHTVLYPRRTTTHVVTIKVYGFVYGPRNGFAQPWYRVWPCMAVPSQHLQSHNDSGSTFTSTLSARTRPSRNVTLLVARISCQLHRVCPSVRPSVRPPSCPTIASCVGLSTCSGYSATVLGFQLLYGLLPFVHLVKF
jgi:hypothetical protein